MGRSYKLDRNKFVEPQPWKLSWLLVLVRKILYPSFYFFDCLLSLYNITFQEENQPDRIFLRKLVLTPIFILLFVLFSPVLIVFMPLRCLLLLLRNRRPYFYSEHHTPYTNKDHALHNEMIDAGCYKFGIASANLCLLPECISKMNHLSDVNGRSKKIGEYFVIDQFFNQEWARIESRKHCKKYSEGNAFYNEEACYSNLKNDTSKPSRPTGIGGKVVTRFSRVDFVMIQESWSCYQSQALVDELHKVFPFIIYDVGIHTYGVNFFGLNSGLSLASRHPILAVEFKPFKSFLKHAKLMCQGLLMAKVMLGTESSNQRKVGYLFNTHLQAYQGQQQVQTDQLDEILEWSREFQRDTLAEKDTVLFSMLCGDFNFDNLSPSDKEQSKHAVFSDFHDFARTEDGTEKSWTVGTEFRQRYMLDSAVSSPEGLKIALDDPALRQCYILDGDVKEQSKEYLVNGEIKLDAQGNVEVFPEGGRRRIDYITFGKSSPVNVEGFHFVTRLASLTDHIPIEMEFTCPGKV